MDLVRNNRKHRIIKYILIQQVIITTEFEY